MELRPPPPIGLPDNAGAQLTHRLLMIQLGALALLVVLLAGHLALSWWPGPRGAAKLTQPDAGKRGENDAGAAHHRDVGHRLLAAGATKAAAAEYERYLLTANTNANDRGAVAYRLGKLYLDSGSYNSALRWFYAAELWGAKPPSHPVGEKIVHTLERMGRVHAAQAALATRTDIASTDPNATAKRSPDDPVVATIGDQPVHRSEVQRSLAAMPPELERRFTGPEGQTALLQRYVADELLWRKAQKLEFADRPDIQEQVAQMLKHLVVAAFVKDEVISKIDPTPADLQTYFEAHKERYQRTLDAEAAQHAKKAGVEVSDPKPVTLAAVRDKVARDYQVMKVQEAYQHMIEQEIAAKDVKLYAERMLP